MTRAAITPVDTGPSVPPPGYSTQNLSAYTGPTGGGTSVVNTIVLDPGNNCAVRIGVTSGQKVGFYGKTPTPLQTVAGTFDATCNTSSPNNFDTGSAVNAPVDANNAIAPLALSFSSTPTQAEVQALQTAINAVITIVNTNATKQNSGFGSVNGNGSIANANATKATTHANNTNANATKTNANASLSELHILAVQRTGLVDLA